MIGRAKMLNCIRAGLGIVFSRNLATFFKTESKLA
jgi:hypothetical protein